MTATNRHDGPGYFGLALGWLAGEVVFWVLFAAGQAVLGEPGIYLGLGILATGTILISMLMMVVRVLQGRDL